MLLRMQRTQRGDVGLYISLLFSGFLAVGLLRFVGQRDSAAAGRRYVLTDLGAFSRQRPLDRPGSLQTHISLRNRRGQAVGSYLCGSDGSQHAALWQQGKRQDLGTLGGKNSFATAINESAQVAGYAALPDSRPHAFLWQNGNMQDLGTLGGPNSWARALNDRGIVIGAADTADGATRAFVYVRGKMRDLGTLGGTESAAWSLNDQGQIVGESETRAGEMHAFLYSDAGMIDLNRQIPRLPDWTLVTATEIDNRGCIRGVGLMRGIQHRFLLTPLSGA